MLKQADLKKKTMYQKTDGYFDISYSIGWALNIQQIDNLWSFDLRQTSNPEHTVKVILNKNDYIPKFMTESRIPLVKVYAKLHTIEGQLFLKAIGLDKPNITEIPKVQGSNHFKTIDGQVVFSQSLDWETYLALNADEQKKILSKLLNQVEVGGYVRAKRLISKGCMELELLNSQEKIIPVKLFNIQAELFYKTLTYLQPIFIVGKIQANINKISQKIEAYIKIERIPDGCIPGLHIPKLTPQWYIDLDNEFKDKVIDGKRSNLTLTNTVNNQEQNLEIKPMNSNVEFDDRGKPKLGTF